MTSTTHPEVLRGRAARRRMSAEDRRQVLAALYLDGDSGRIGRFAILLFLSVVIATLGLVADSTVVVVGAMLIAPLMSPVLGAAGAIVMGWTRRLFSSLALVVGGSVGGISVAYLLTKLTPANAFVVLPDEVLARTRPATVDLLVALAAGTAGAIATVREDTSTALPGVAVAVALVPPLSTVGITFALGDTHLAGQALLLYVTNLVAIVAAGSAVFIASGFVPRFHLRERGTRARVGVGIAVLAVIAVSIPLRAAGERVIDDGRRRVAVDAAVESWLGAGSPMEVTNVRIKGDSVTIDIVGPADPPATDRLADELRRRSGAPTHATVRWTIRNARTVEVDQTS